MTSELRTQFGALVKRHRLAAGLTQVEVAAAVGASQIAVSSWERGQWPPIERLTVLAELLSIDLGDLTPDRMAQVAS